MKQVGNFGGGGGVADLSVTTAKLADGAVTSAKIADGTIVAGDIADGTITAAKLAFAAGDFTWVVKTADESVTSSALQDDEDLLFTVESNKVYLVQLGILLFSAALPRRINVQFNVPSIPDGNYYNVGMSGDNNYWGDQSGAAYVRGMPVTSGTQFLTLGNNGISGAQTAQMMTTVGLFAIKIGATGGTARLRWASTDGATQTILAGSYLAYKKLN